jgi:hypothetical protein
MRFLLLYIFVLFVSCNQNSTSIEKLTDQSRFNEICVDTTEKHFDCIIHESYEDSSGDYVIITECGLCIRVDSIHQVGDTLKGFYSPKHK